MDLVQVEILPFGERTPKNCEFESGTPLFEALEISDIDPCGLSVLVNDAVVNLDHELRMGDYVTFLRPGERSDTPLPIGSTINVRVGKMPGNINTFQLDSSRRTVQDAFDTANVDPGKFEVLVNSERVKKENHSSFNLREGDTVIITEKIAGN
ncbi:hypothetical protein ACFL14_01010 [Patescibacteria group bacterium]